MSQDGRLFHSTSHVAVEVQSRHDLVRERWSKSWFRRRNTPAEPLASKSARGELGYRRDIDGLRAIAVLAVVAFHCGCPWLRGGFIGVDIFFVISGYLICSIIFRETQQGTFSIARFYKRRCKRILPALAVVLLFCFGMAALVLSPLEAHRLGDSGIAAALSSSNILFIFRSGYFAEGAPTTPLLMTWSLAVEEQFYLAFPLIMILLQRTSRRGQLLCLTGLSVASLLACVYAEFHLPVWNFYLPVTRAWELGAGTILAVWQSGTLRFKSAVSWKTEILGAVGILIVICSMMVYSPHTRFPGYEAALPVLGTLLLLASAGSRVNRMLETRPLVAVGLISYSLYLWHWPLLSFAEVLSTKPLHTRTIAILMLFAFLAASLSYIFVEKPFRQRKESSTRSVLLAYAALIVFLATVGGIFSATHGLGLRDPTLYAIESRAALDRHHPCISSGSYLRMSALCVPPARTNVPAIALLGDSHAEAISEILRGYASRQGWQLVVLTREKCPPTQGETRLSNVPIEPCREFNRSALKYIRSRPDIQVIFLTAGWGGVYIADRYQTAPADQNMQQSAANLKIGLQSEVGALEAAGKHVIVMDDVPGLTFDPAASVRYEHIAARRFLNRILLSDPPDLGSGDSEDRSLAVTPSAVVASEQLAAIKSADAGLTLIDPKNVLCSDTQCFFTNKSDLYYADSSHISRMGALKLLPLLPQLATVRQGITHDSDHALSR
jgi:peptidoglycan/LPS O-acetylase OafA/YrhL